MKANPKVLTPKEVGSTPFHMRYEIMVVLPITDRDLYPKNNWFEVGVKDSTGKMHFIIVEQTLVGYFKVGKFMTI